MKFRQFLALLAVMVVLLASWTALAAASKEMPGTILRLSLAPDDPFFIRGDVVTLFVDANTSTTVSGNVGIGVALPPELSRTACPASGDRLLVFFTVGTTDGSQCLSAWIANPSSRITQLRGVTLPAGTRVHQVVLQQSITAGLPTGTFTVFAYILDASNPAVVIDLTTTTVDLE
jgi:hypothetical protein